MNIGIYGNCQHASYREVLAKMLPEASVSSILAGEDVDILKDCDVLLYQSDYSSTIDNSNTSQIRIKIPTFYFLGFFPDLVMEHLPDGRILNGPAGSLQSAIILNGFVNGYNADTIEKMFNPETYDILGYHDYWRRSINFMTNNIDECGMNGELIVRKWINQGVFCHTANHPTIKAVSVVCDEICKVLGLKSQYKGKFFDPLQWHGTWPIYPGIAESHGVKGSLEFQFGEVLEGERRAIIPLRQFIEASLESYASQIDSSFKPQRLSDNPHYKQLDGISKPRRKPHVYSNLPSSSYWKQAISSRTIFEVDPVVEPRFKLKKTDRIITAGSCFAQHIAKKLTADGFNYHIAELPPKGMSAEKALERGYGLFSARYGNVYTARQLRMLVERAMGMFEPVDTAWQRPDGRWIDPYRQQLEPEEFESAEAVVAEAERHLTHVRQMFVDADIFVFTLGLTECWIAKEDGSAFPTAPGVIAGEMDPSRYAFVNFNVSDVRDDLIAAIQIIRQKNPAMRFILTVSPVPLVATFDKKHVLTATTYSKSALRAAVNEIVNIYDFVEYFPSYEIITGNYAMGSFFEADKREVNSNGVSKVMGLLQKHYFETDTGEQAVSTRVSDDQLPRVAGFSKEFARSAAIICDEELLEKEV